MPTLYHLTPEHNLPTIKRQGLRPEMAQKAKRVWLVTREKLAWARQHITKRHGTVKIATLKVKVTDAKKHGWPGLFYTLTPIAPTRLWRVR